MLGLNHEFDYEEIVNGISEILENKLIGDTMERLCQSTKVFSVFGYIKLLSWSLLFIWFLPPHETVKTQ